VPRIPGNIYFTFFASTALRPLIALPALPSGRRILAFEAPIVVFEIVAYALLISMSTPLGRSSLISASIVLFVGSRISISRLWVRSSKCSMDSLSMCGPRITQNRRIFVGKGVGPATRAPVRFAVSVIFSADWSMIRWSKARSLILTLIPAIVYFFIKKPPP